MKMLRNLYPTAPFDPIRPSAEEQKPETGELLEDISDNEDVKKFVPYRSPFDPIRPAAEDQKAETSELLDDNEDVKIESEEEKHTIPANRV
jgi:hypothetical protein